MNILTTYHNSGIQVYGTAGRFKGDPDQYMAEVTFYKNSEDRRTTVSKFMTERPSMNAADAVASIMKALEEPLHIQVVEESYKVIGGGVIPMESVKMGRW